MDDKLSRRMAAEAETRKTSRWDSIADELKRQIDRNERAQLPQTSVAPTKTAEVQKPKLIKKRK
jgi:hypothetical protein